MLDTFRKVYKLLTRRERKSALFLLLLMGATAIVESLGIASVLPVMSVVGRPELIEENPHLHAVYSFFAFSTKESFLLALGIFAFTALMFSIVVRATTTYLLHRYTQMRIYSLSRRMVAGYLTQPYDQTLNRNSATVSTTVLSEVSQVIGGSLFPLMQLVANVAVATAIVALLVVVNPGLASTVAVGLVSVYALIYILLRRYLVQIGRDRLEANRARFLALHEAFGSFKEMKVGCLEENMLHRFEGPALRFAKKEAGAKIATQIPRFAVEALVFGGLLFVVVSVLGSQGLIGDALPTLTLYAFAGYRLMPALQSLYSQLAALRYAGPALDALSRDLGQFPTPKPLASLNLSNGVIPDARHHISLRNITYSYPGANRPSVRDISLDITPNSTVALVGRTGSGKTTLVDIILGLLVPQEGNLLVDGSVLTTTSLCQWRRNIGYVPQSIYLSDASVASNIAFGRSPDSIDYEAVERAARIANLHKFVTEELPSGYDTLVGERGVRLSGGQRQRIGIARALYRDPGVLILDEATSALDNLTEQAVMEAVSNLASRKTIIIIAHRFSTIMSCNLIFLLEGGRLTGVGNFGELKAKNPGFFAMTEKESNNDEEKRSGLTSGFSNSAPPY